MRGPLEALSRIIGFLSLHFQECLLVVWGCGLLRSEWVCDEDLSHVLAALTPPNRLACKIAIATGMRIGDVLSITAEQVKRGRFSYHEQKTGKVRRIRLPVSLQREALQRCGTVYLFPARSDGKKHRTRQAVYKDVKRAAKAFRLPQRVSPHTMRKCYAVAQFSRSGGDLSRIQRDMNHGSPAITMIYAMADALTQKRLESKGK